MAYKKRIFVTVLMLLIISCQLFAATNTKINMNFKGADIRDVLRTIAELAGVNLVTDGSVSGEITVHLKDLLFNDALKLITQTNDLEYKWYENTVVVATPEKMDEIYANIIVKTVEVKYASLTEVREVIIGVYPQIEIIPDPRNNKLIFKGRVEDIRVAEDLLAKLDTEKEVSFDIVMVPADKAEFLKNYIQKVYPEMVVESDEQGNFVMYGTAYDIESASLLLNNLVKQLSGGAYLGGTYALLESIKINYLDVNYVRDLVGEMYPDVNIIADSKNSQLIFNGSEEQLRQIKDLVSRIDVASVEGEETYISKTVEIENVDINFVITELESISRSLNISVLTDKQLSISGNKNDVERAISRTKALDIEAEKMTRVLSVDYVELEELEKIVSELFPDISVLTNPQKREVIISGKRQLIEEALVLIDEIDIPRKQVIIEVKIQEVYTRDMQDLGVNPEQLSNIRFFDKNDNSFIDEVALTFPEILKFLEENEKTNTLARPHLMTLSGEEASMLIGDELPIPIQSYQDGVLVTTIEYIKLGVNLIFTPWVTSDNHINLKVAPQVTGVGGQVAGVSIPRITTRKAETNVRLRSGETLAIGGILQDELVETINKVPILGDIPILGTLFKNRNVKNLQTELVIMITPYIVEDGEVIKEVELPNEVIVSDIENTVIDEKLESIKETVKSKEIAELENEEITETKVVSEDKETDVETKVNVEEKPLQINKDRQIKEENNTEKNLKFLSLDEINNLLGIDEKREATRIKEEKDHSTSTSYESKPLDNDIPDESIGEVEKEEPEDKFTPEIIIEEPEPVDLSTYYLYKYPLKSETAIKDIASLFSVDEELIKAANKDNDLVVGGFAVIPLEESRIHVMEKGETLWKIHNLYGVSVEDIKLLNNISDDSNIPVGVVIVIPEK